MRHDGELAGRILVVEVDLGELGLDPDLGNRQQRGLLADKKEDLRSEGNAPND